MDYNHITDHKHITKHKHIAYHRHLTRHMHITKHNHITYKLLSVRVAELMAFQRSKVLDVDGDMYPVSYDMVHATNLVSLSPLSSFSMLPNASVNRERIIIAKCPMPQLIEKESS
jgi:hypothetical protein